MDSQAQATRPLVLIVDDDAGMRLLARASLAQAGFEVEEAQHGAAALAMLPGARPDIILMDVMMPEMDGFAACRALRSTPGAEHTPVVMVTGLDDIESIHHAYAVGATDFVTKPINWVILVHRVRYVLRASQAVAALRESEERYALAARGANDGLWDWRLESGTIYLSPRWKATLGYQDHEIGDDPGEWLDRIHRDDVDAVKTALAAHMENATPDFEAEYRILHKDGTYRWMLCRGMAVRDGAGKAYRLAGSQTDVTQRRRAEDQLVHDAFHDGLTGLPNRALFMDRLAHSLKFARRHESYAFAVLFLDLDRFKVVNDSLGHTFGDRLLVEVSRRLLQCLRSSDTVARLGGDEFTVLLDDVNDEATVNRFVERIQRQLSSAFDLDGHEVVTSASIGITMSSVGYEKPEEMLRDADTAMYRAKALGKARCVIFDAAMHRRAVALLELETQLRAATKRGEFRLFYQPIVSLNAEIIIGFEALLRWDHPRRGLLRPEAFLLVAEETGLIVPIGRWVLAEACRQMRHWQERWPATRGLFVSVNLSSKEFAQPGLMDEVDTALRDAGLDPSSLKLEITENVLIENTRTALEVLSRLRERNIRLSIDDFGTGYSSLSYLHRFPFNTLKIDRSFVARLGVDRDSREIVRAIVTLAHNLGMDVVAEGGETFQHIDQLKALSCEHGQGYFFSEPVSAAAATALIEARWAAAEPDSEAENGDEPARLSSSSGVG